MTCRSCGLEIADKAIVCYRCGTPAADLPATQLEPAGWSIGVAVPLILALVGLVWLVSHPPADSQIRWGSWIVEAVLFAAVLWRRRWRKP